MLIGRRIGSYEILAKLGEGGMGAVYRARDTKLDRDVAIKVLPASFASDRDRLLRFDREAKTLAALNHPHIAGIYGFEDAGETKALVMELVEGEDLSQRIARGAIALDEALPIARQIAEALEAAHEQGIVHRDLKPANIKVRPDGTVKVLDFGLAKAMDPVAPASHEAMHAATITTPAMTQAGMILGTAAYMSPEQAAGKPVDKRTDLWAFGVVLLEMLTGQRIFDGETVSHVIAAVLTREPDWSALPADTPAPIRRLLRRCLQKDRRKRLADAADARLDIEEAVAVPATDSSAAGAAVTAVPQRRQRWAPTLWGVAGFVGASVLAFAVFGGGPPAATPQAVVSAIEVPELALSTGPAFAISPDGHRLVFVAPDNAGRRVLWVRPLASLEAQALAGTEGAASPFWSPDSRHIAFVAGGTLKRVEVSGGTPVTLAAEASGVSAGTWSRDDVILFLRGREISRVSARGGAATTTSAGPYFPYFLPDGQHFLYLQERNVHLRSLGGGDDTVLIENAGNVAYADGHLLFMRETTLYAQAFDAARLVLAREPVPLAERVQINTGSGAGKFSVSETGTLVYQATSTAPSRLVWFDRAGREVGEIGDPDRYSSVRLSADGATLAASVWAESSGDRDIWLLETRRGVRTRLTSGSDDDTDPLPTADGSMVAYSSRRGRVKGLYVKNPQNASPARQLAEDGFNKSANAWSGDHEHLLFESMSAATRFDLWLTGSDATVAPTVVLQGDEAQWRGEFSPDGRFLTYQSAESGLDEVYLARFPVGSERWPVSTGGGANPHWSKDGKELFFMRGASLMRAAVNGTAAAVEIGTAAPLFSLRQRPAAGTTVFSVSPDGQRFLFNLPVNTGPAPITLVMNWRGLLSR